MLGWMNIARGLKLLALVLFLTPWLVVSCQGSPLIEASGLDLITGDIDPSRDSPLGSMMAQNQIDMAEADTVGAETQASDPAGSEGIQGARWWALIGAVVIAAGVVLSFVLRPARLAATGMLAAGALALAVLGGGMAWTINAFESEMRAAFTEQSTGTDEMSQLGRNMAAGMAGAIRIEVKAGYWWTLILIGLGVGAAFMAMSGARLPQVTVGPRDA